MRNDKTTKPWRQGYFERLRSSDAALEQCQMMIEQAGDGIAVIEDGRITFANTSLAFLLGYARQQLTGQCFDRYVAMAQWLLIWRPLSAPRMAGARH